LKIFDKVLSITCDGAPNMVALFNYFTRTDIDRIQCICHKVHLIVCNGLGIWLKRAAIIKEDTTTITDVDEHLSQTVKKINIDENVNTEQSNDEDDDEDDEDDDEVNIINQNVYRKEMSLMFNIFTIFLEYTFEDHRSYTH
jgi:hypothetical protein